MSTFSPTHIDRRMVLALTDLRHYERGLAYAQDARVTLLTATAHAVEARVTGTESYNVQLQWRNGALHGECDCPVGVQNVFCKHQVAVALTWAQATTDDVSLAPSGRQTKATPAQNPRQVLQQWLADQSTKTL